MIGHVDTPRPGQRLENDAAVTGWALWDEGIAVIEIVIDDAVLGTASLGYERPDVLAAHPGNGNQYSGWAAKIDLAGVGPGIRWLTVLVRSRGGTVKQLDSVPIVINRPETAGI